MSNPIVLLETDRSRLLVYRDFVDANMISEYTQLAMDLPLVERPEIRIFGRVCRQQRNVGFFAQPEVPGYKYSGQQTAVIDIANFAFLQTILTSVNLALDAGYNGILVNLYQNGTNYISAHSDDESGLDPIGVASIAFGAVRTFRIRNKTTGSIVLDVPHNAGDLLVMAGDFQSEFTHEIPIQKKVTEARVSLTFRLHKK